MLHLHINQTELFNETTNIFTTFPSRDLQLEHSLVSLSKWESRWKKPFLTKEKKTQEETIDYIRCMTITQNVPDVAYSCLSQDNLNEIERYIEDPMTATTFAKDDRVNRDIITAEIIYYWMVTLQIPYEYQKWHLNRLIALIQVCNIKNQPPKKRSKRNILNDNRALNNSRRAALNSKG